MKVTKRINVEVLSKKFVPTINAVQYDTGLQIVMSIKDFDIPEGTTAKVFFEKPSGKFVYQKGTISGNDITIDVENQSLAEYGFVYYQVRLINVEDIITTFSGKIDVEKSLADSSATSSETIVPAFDAVVQNAVTEIESARDSAIQFIGNGLDATLTTEGKAADAAATGKAIDELKGDLEAERNARIEDDTDHSTRLQKVEVASSVNRYEIDNLKAKAEGKLYRTETVEAETYTVDVPSSVAPYAEVQRIGGKSVVWNQLVDPISQTVNGVTVTASIGTWTLSGTATSSGGRLTTISSSFINMTSGHKYAIMLSKNISIDILLSDKNSNNVVTGINSSTIFTPNSSYVTILGLNLVQGTTYSGTIKINIFDLTQMFGAGNEPTLEECVKIFSADYYPYDAGTIKSFPVRTVRSVGKNLLNPSKLRDGDYNGTNKTIRVSVDVGNRVYVNKGTKVSLSFIETPVVKRIWLILTDSSNKAVEELFLNSTENRTATTTKDGYLTPIFGGTNIDGGWGLITVNDVIEANPQIEIGEITSYSPYKESTLDLSSVTSELKSAGSVHDEWDNGKKIIRLAEYDFGFFTWTYDSTYNFWYSNKALPNQKDGTYIFCETVPFERMELTGSNLGTAINGTANVWVRNGSSTNPPTGKVIYQIATPTEETIPEISNFIQVEGGGTLTFESDDVVHMPVPSTDRFVVDLS